MGKQYFYVIYRPQVQPVKFLPNMSKKISKLMFKDKPEKNKKGKDPKQQQQQQQMLHEVQAKLKRQPLIRQQQPQIQVSSGLQFIN